MPGAIVDDKIDLDFFLYGLTHDLRRVLNHLRIQHARDDHLVNGKALD